MVAPKSEKCATCTNHHFLHDTSHLGLNYVLVCRGSKCKDAHVLKGYRRLYALSLNYSILVYGEYWKPCPKPEENGRFFIINT